MLDENNPCDEPGCRLAPEVDRKLTEYDRADQTESLMLIGVREADPVPTFATGKGPVA